MEKRKDKKKKPYMMPQDQLTQTTGWLGTIFLATVAALFILVGGVMLFVDGVKELYLIYMISALLIALGIGLIVKYFVTEAYRSVHDYGFSGGALIVILGGCALARAGQLTMQIAAFVGLLVLSVAVVMLQQAMQLHIMRKKVWTVVLAISLVTLLSSVLLLFDISAVTGKVEGFEYWVLLAAGVLTLLCMLISGIGVRIFLHQERDEMLRMHKEQQLAFAREEDQKRLESTMKKIEDESESEKTE
ncbi:MAG: hypothetical protein PUK75_00040 [bacterium]|nr:hypothetical protein [bacterium]MDY4100101.1 hypothetical protein [Lachnospiraceae bacterium]